MPAIEVPCRTYFNSGVLLINLNEWRKQNIEKKCLNIAPYLQSIFCDQDLLNAILIGKVAFMDWSWNATFTLCKFFISGGLIKNGQLIPLEKIPLPIGASEIYDFPLKFDHPCIVHFIESKPWAKDFLHKYSNDSFEVWFRHQKHWLDIDGKVEFYLKNIMV